jgi:ABC-type uncharacterized transport system substrate-binding protein
MKIAMANPRRMPVYIAFLALLVSVPLVPMAGASESLKRVLVIRPLDPPDNNQAVFAGLLEGLARYGWKPGKNIVVQDMVMSESSWSLYAFGRADEADIAFSLTFAGTLSIRSKLASSGTPLVFASSDVIARYLVGALDRPSEKNMLAVYYESGAKTLLPLVEFLPDHRSALLVLDSNATVDRLIGDDFAKNNPKPDISVIRLESAGKGRAETAAAIADAGASVLIGCGEGWSLFAAEGSLPALPVIGVRISADKRLAATNEIAGIDYPGSALGRAMGEAGGRILAGKSDPASAYPIKAAGRVFVNLAAMKRLGITLPPAIIAQAGILIR